MKELNWAVIGTGWIATEMAEVFQKHGRSLYGVANRTYEKAVAYAKTYGISKVYDSIDQVFTDDAVDVVYIATPHNFHYEFMIKALKAGKHVLVEKAATLNSLQLDTCIEIADEKNLLLAEACTIWHMPIHKLMWQKLQDGEFGKVQIITVNFGSFKEYDMSNRFFNLDLAGGAMLDIGIYALSAVRGYMTEKPDTVLSQWKPSPTGSDESSVILLRNKTDQMATVALTMHSKQPKRAMISCEKGYFEIMNYPRATKAEFVDANTGEKILYEAGEETDALYYEVMDFEEAVETKRFDSMKLSWSKDVMDIMTFLRKEWGMKYPGEDW